MQLQHEPPRPWLVQQPGGTLSLNRRSALIADDQVDSIEALAILLEW